MKSKKGAKVVMKNNTAKCVLLSAKEYTDLIDELNDAHLLVIASQRLQNLDSSNLISQDEVYKRLSIKEEDLDDYDQVEFEWIGKSNKTCVKDNKQSPKNPLPISENGYGKPLGNYKNAKLNGLLKIKLRNARLRIVYLLQKSESNMLIIVIGIREDEEVYEIASNKVTKHNL